MVFRKREFPGSSRMAPTAEHTPIVDRLVQEPFLIEVQTVAAL